MLLFVLTRLVKIYQGLLNIKRLRIRVSLENQVLFVNSVELRFYLFLLRTGTLVDKLAGFGVVLQVLGGFVFFGVRVKIELLQLLCLLEIV